MTIQTKMHVYINYVFSTRYMHKTKNRKAGMKKDRQTHSIQIQLK